MSQGEETVVSVLLAYIQINNFLCCYTANPPIYLRGGALTLIINQFPSLPLYLKVQCLLVLFSDFCIGKSLHTAHKYINKSVYSQYNKKIIWFSY